MVRDVENPMVIDSLWDELDQIDREQDEDDEEFYIRDDEEYDEEAAYIAEHGWGRANGYVL